jgi:hypothetical protein
MFPNQSPGDRKDINHEEIEFVTVYAFHTHIYDRYTIRHRLIRDMR